MEPSVFGIFRPILLLPENIERHLSPAQFRAVLAHEMGHVRRRDNLLSSIHMISAAIFWFYPVVWWLGARLLDERERACDEHVLYQGNDSIVYAESILKVCEVYVKSPLQCAPGVSGSKLEQRIRRIVTHTPTRPLGSRKACMLAATAVAVLAAPISSGIFNAGPRSQNPSERASTASKPSFEVASVKQNNDRSIPAALRYTPSGIDFARVPLTWIIGEAYQLPYYSSTAISSPDNAVRELLSSSDGYDISAGRRAPFRATRLG